MEYFIALVVSIAVINSLSDEIMLIKRLPPDYASAYRALMLEA